MTMLSMIRALFEHQAYADAALLNAVSRNESAARDPEIRTLFHHILVAHRFWIHLAQNLPFVRDDEARVPESLAQIAARFRATQDQEREWLAHMDEADLGRTLDVSYFPGRKIPVSDALMQVCLHSQGHRAQCATKLRAHGGEPPTVDFILWLQTRAAPAWDDR